MTYNPLIRLLGSSLLTAVLLVGSRPLHAQNAGDFQITKIEVSMPPTPLVTFSGTPRGTGNSKKWLEIEASFFWKPSLSTTKYSDNVVLNYYVLLKNPSVQFPHGTLLSGQVTHSGFPSRQIEQGDLKSVMYISPRTLEQFFQGRVPFSSDSAVVDVGVTISQQGQVVAMKSYKGTGAWWLQMQQTSGFLLNKDETPFAPLYWDYYEPVKKQ
jgi:hypothetical protein